MDRPLLEALPDLLGDEPALTSVLGRRSAALVVPEPARAIVLAAVARRSGRRPLLTVVPTGSEAERLAGDLGHYLGPDEVELFPAWETLPFERLSPGIETMGHRMRILNRLTEPAGRPAVVVASGRALVQRLTPGAGEVRPLLLGPGDIVDQTGLVDILVAAGYRREYQVEHRGELAVRGSIL
ncbi:MAG TPA: transcription-repair coupling factor, partial [Acidimicrobiaceae bacterium]|nr:transcription-repair coupling factor [Acidimicrobiaceae bacterium]